jgi:hypothetical protein
LPDDLADLDPAVGLLGERDGLGRGLLAKLLGQSRDLSFGVATVATERLQERQLALLGPRGHRLGLHVQDLSHLGGSQIAGIGACGVAAGLGCHGASLS